MRSDIHNATNQLTLARNLAQANKAEEAINILSEICVKSPKHIEARFLLGVMQARTGALTEAARTLEYLIKQSPNHAMAYIYLGQIYTSLNRFENAIHHFEHAILLSPDSADGFLGIGAAKMFLDDYDEALPDLLKAIELSPNTASAHLNIGIILTKQGQYAEAIQHLDKCLSIDPDNFYACLKLGETYRLSGNTASSIASYRRAIQLRPNNADAYLSLGSAEEQSGEYESALQHYEKAATLYQNNSSAQIAAAAMHERIGNIKAAYHTIKPLLEQRICNTRLGLVYSCVCEEYNERRHAIEYLENILSSLAITPEKKAAINFALGELYENAQEYDTAFSHIQRANAALEVNYIPGHDINITNKIIVNTQKHILRPLTRYGSQSNRPIFIIGMPRSGTSLVERVLSSHSQVYGGGELLGIENTSKMIQVITGSSDPYPICLSELTKPDVHLLFNKYLQSLPIPEPGKSRISDKMPHNFRHLGLINILFPNAAVIHVRRNPLDTCLSCYFNHLSKHHSYACNLEHLATHYEQYNRLMRHWKETLCIPMLDVKYEDLVTTPEDVCRNILEHCKLEWEDNCLNSSKTSQSVKTISYYQVRQDIYSRSINRWKHYETHIQPLLDKFPPQTTQ